MSPPTGTVTFLFSDIEGSTAAWERTPELMSGVLARHDRLLRTAIAAHSGYVFATGGDGFAVAFASVADALGMAVDAQRALRTEPWPDELPIRVRMAVNSGEVVERDGDYFGPAVNRTARMMSTANGGQVVVSERSAGLVEAPPAGAVLEERGEHRLKDLRRPERIHELVIDGAPGRPLRTAPISTTTASSLPSFRTSFVGRNEEAQTLDDATSRLITLVGPGGAGKTRLASEHAGRNAAAHRDGAWFVDLVTARGDDVLDVVLTTLGLASIDDQLAALRGWDALVVLDNCEHVLDDVAGLVDDLLERCPDLHILATSRQPLHLDGEQLLRIGGLDDAVGLFVERARLADPDFAPDPEEVEAIRVLCDRLDGLPLAIELAAARVRVVGLDQLAAAILDGDTGRPTRGRPERHRDLQAVLQWSIDLLDDADATVLRRLALFEGGFTRDAAEAVASDELLDARAVSEALAVLADASMVQTERTDSGIRFRLLETVRSVAHDLLVDHGELDQTAIAHLDWITEWSSRSGIVRLDRAGWLGDRREVANQRVGLRHALRLGRTTQGSALLSRAAWSLTLSGFVTEMQDTLLRFRSADGADDPDTATLLDLAELAVAELVGDFVRSHELALRFASSDDRTLAATGASIATHHLAATNPQEARDVLGQYEADHGAIPHTTFMHAEIALGEGRFADAVDSMLDALDVRAVTDLGRGTPPDGGIIVDLTVALLALDRLDEATLALETAPDDATFGGAAYGPLLTAAIAASRGETGVVGDLRHAFELEVRFGIPLADLDCVVLGAHVAMSVGRPEVAAVALGVTRGQPQRALSMFAMRRMLRGRLQATLGDAEFRGLSGSGSGRRPRDAFGALIEELAALP
jgi:predicted ATPase/class 3 adenylate cyclase